jgi:hypothetical protein
MTSIVLIASNSGLLQQTISTLQREFAMKDIGLLHHFLGVTVERRPRGLFLYQHTYLKVIIECAGMTGCKSCTTPVDLKSKLFGDSRPPMQDAS